MSQTAMELLTEKILTILAMDTTMMVKMMETRITGRMTTAMAKNEVYNRIRFMFIYKVHGIRLIIIIIICYSY